jgi:hypothetical protein
VPTVVSKVLNFGPRLIAKAVCSFAWCVTPLAFAAPTVTILSPKSASDSGSPVFYEAYATSPACASGISAMRIYTASGVNAYTVNGAHIETFITLAAGSYSAVVQAWDNCGGVAKTPVNITVKNTAGVSVFFADERSCKHSSSSGGISTKSGVLRRHECHAHLHGTAPAHTLCFRII